MNTKNARVVITGANRGIGRAVANRLAQENCYLWLLNRTVDRELESELRGNGAAGVEQIALDMRNKEDLSRVLSRFDNQEIDIVFNNAGQLTGGWLDEQPIDDIYSMFQVNVLALVHISHYFVGKMVRRKKGKIINHSSVSAIMPFPSASTYAASKSAVLMFTRCLQSELRDTGVSTLCLVTPAIDTRMYGEIPKLYGRSMDVKFLPQGESPEVYAEKIHQAILDDTVELMPKGFQRLGLVFAQHSPGLFWSVVESRFKQSRKMPEN
jgi:short-subunit dehydrogenase